MTSKDLLRFWPLKDDLAACLKIDAEAVSEAVSAAVHQPMQFERRLIGGESGTLTVCDECELLRVFTDDNLPDGRVIVPIVGSSGTGKSHVLRWLDTQLRHGRGNDRRVVIRIPKGTSLKGVLAILLSELRGSAYNQYRQELTRAQLELERGEAAGLLCETLAYTIGEMGDEARKKAITDPSDKDAQERVAFCRNDMLPSLLRNQLLRDQHFVQMPGGRDGVVTRLVEQLTEERSPTEQDDRQHQFAPNDLVFSEAIDQNSLGRAELRAISLLDREDRRKAAARILNTALDGAKQRLLRLDPTVSELFNAVREQLLREQKELVLLVEDFAVLSGLQKQLLQVIIREAFRDGRQVLCTMRTALAYTTGYMDTATVLTRANVEYRIPDDPGGEEAIFARIERLVGAYLNAARFGQASLEEVWANRPEEWVPHFSAQVEPETKATLEEFGLSENNYELFPLNSFAIRELARAGCVTANKLVYNPRFVIQNVINKVLGQRDLFERGLFPPPSFQSQTRPLPARVIEDLKRRVPISELDRYQAFLTYWGGFPSSLDETASTGNRVFAAFGLERSRLFSGGMTSPPLPKPKGVEDNPKTGPKTPDRTNRDENPTESRWERVLEEWRGGQSLSQSDANTLRKWIAEGLKAFIDWDWDAYRPLKASDLDTWHQYVYFPRAGGGGGRSADESMVAVCNESDLINPTISASVQSALMAVVRFRAIHDNSWDYAGAEADLPRYLALLEGMADNARDFVRKRYFRAVWDPTPSLVQGLLIGARALGIESAAKDRDHASLIQALFELVPNDPSAEPVGPTNISEPAGWKEFTGALQRCRRFGEKESRGQLSWQGHLLNLLGARQGQADLVHAINVRNLKPALEQVLSCFEFNSSLPNPTEIPEYPAFRMLYQEIRKYEAAVPRTQKRLTEWRRDMIQQLGGELDKDSFVRELKETIISARDSGLASGLNSKELLQLLEGFRLAKVKAALDDVEKLTSETPRGLVLAVLGRGHEAVASLCRELTDGVDKFLQEISARLANDVARYGKFPVEEALTLLREELQQLEATLGEVKAL